MSTILGLPKEGIPYLEATIMYVAETQDKALIKKIEEICAPIIQELIQPEKLPKIKASTGVIDFDLQVTTNAHRAIGKWIEDNFPKIEEDWENKYKDELGKLKVSDDMYQHYIEWVPTNCIASLCKDRII